MLYIQVKDKEIVFVFLKRTRKKIAVQKLIRMDLSVGMVVNGFVQDEEHLISKLQEIVGKYRLQNKKVVLTVDSTFIVYREMTTPVLRKKALESYVYHSLKQQVNAIEDFVIDYAVLKQDKQMQLLAVMMPMNMLDLYQRIAKQCKLKLACITTTPLNLIRGYQFEPPVPPLSSQIVMAYNGDVINTVLFNHGEYIFANAYRTFGTASTPIALMERISQMMQFQKAQNMGIQVQKVSLYGEIEDVVAKQIASTLGIEVVCNVSPAQVDNQSRDGLEGTLVAIFSAIKGTYRDYNLVSGINQKRFTTKFEATRQANGLLWVLVLNVMVLVVAGALVYKENKEELGRRDEFQMRLENPILQQKYLRAMELSAQTVLYENQVKEVASLQKTLLHQRAFHYAIYQSILSHKPADVSWQSLSYMNDTLTLQVSSKNRSSTYIFAQNLRDSDVFYEVRYTGFSFDETSKLYNYQLHLVLRVGDYHEVE